MQAKKIITLDNLMQVEAQAPHIISASRSTDIPAFYMDWLMKRIDIGYLAWTNPFNGVKSYISFENCHFIVFWSKNPKPLLKYIDALKERGINCYIQYTLNDYHNEGLEKVPALSQRIKTFKQLSDKLGADAVIWRFDPLFLSSSLSISSLVQRLEAIADQLFGYTEKLVFSFADIASYKKVQNNLIKRRIDFREWPEQEMELIASQISSLNKRKWNFELATCAEKIDLSKYGIKHNRCIDGDLIVKLAWRDEVLMKQMGVKLFSESTDLFGLSTLPLNAKKIKPGLYYHSDFKKDKGQRLACGCMKAKDIGQYNTCPHACEYCYANTNIESAKENWKNHLSNPFSETITGK